MIQTVTAKVSLQLLQRQVITATATHSAAILHKEGHEERSGALRHAEDRSSSAARHGVEDGHGTATVQVVWATEVVIGRVMRRRRREAAIISHVAPLRGQTAPVQAGAMEAAPDGPTRLRRGSSSGRMQDQDRRQSPRRKQASQTQSVRCIGEK